MENQEKALEKAQEKLNKTLEDINQSTGLFQNVVIYLTDKDSNVLVKGAMEYNNLLALQQLHGANSAEIVSMLFTALEDELKQKNYEKQQSTTKEKDVTKN